MQIDLPVAQIPQNGRTGQKVSGVAGEQLRHQVDPGIVFRKDLPQLLVGKDLSLRRGEEGRIVPVDAGEILVMEPAEQVVRDALHRSKFITQCDPPKRFSVIILHRRGKSRITFNKDREGETGIRT